MEEGPAGVSRGADVIARWVTRWLDEHAGIRGVEVDTTFESLHLSSVDAVRLSGDLGEWLARDLDPTLAYDYPTIASLSQFLSGDRVAPSAPDEVVAAEDAREPIAVVGWACRFPGAPDVEAFWNLLYTGADVIREVPPHRWDAAAGRKGIP